MPTNFSTNLDGSVSPSDTRIAQAQLTLSDTNQVSLETYTYSNDPYNNKTDIYESDFGNGLAGPWLRHTHRSFVTAGYDTLTGTHLPSLVAEEIVYDGNGNQAADILSCYDQQTGTHCRQYRTFTSSDSPQNRSQSCPYRCATAGSFYGTRRLRYVGPAGKPTRID
jgi:hypothetical protein